MVKWLPKVSLKMLFFHTGAWLLYTLGMYVYNINNYKEPAVSRIVALVFLMALAFYTILGCLFWITSGRKHVIVLMYSMLLLVGLVCAGYGLVYMLLPRLGIQLYLSEVPYSLQQFAYNAFRVLKEMAKYAAVYFIAYHLIQASRLFKKSKLRLVSAWRLLNEQEMEETKGVLAPHFLMNAFNHCYTFMTRINEVVAKRLLYLSDVIGYSLDNHEEPGLRTVTLRKELEELHHLLYAYYGNDETACPLQLICTGNIKGWRIPAFALITCLENMVKYAVLEPDKKQAAIRIGAGRKTLIITGINAMARENEETPSKGIGLINLSKLLRYQYGKQANLSYWEEEGIFVFLLTISFQ